MEKSILETLEPLVYDDLKVGSIMGGRNLELAQVKLYAWREWIQNHWKNDENIQSEHVGLYSVYHNKFSKDIILYYALKGYTFFANSLKSDPERLMKMALKAHAIELGPKYKKPRVIPVDPLRVNIQTVTAFQRSNDLFLNPENYIKRDKNKKLIIDKSGWLPNEGEFSSPIFLWQVLSAYETNLFSFEYFIKAQKLSKGEYENDWDDTRDSDSGDKGEPKRYYSERLKDIIRAHSS
jgi:hypothetical protein